MWRPPALAKRALAVAGGIAAVMVLIRLHDTSGTAAGYYQGIGSVRRIGMLPETRRYVTSVMALRPRFGGPQP